MKARKLIIKNIGIVGQAEIELNKPLLILYGEVRQGKTTALNAIKWVFGGKFPSDILKNGETEGSITLALDNGTITRSFYRAKDGSVKARPIQFERDGAPVIDPVAEIKRFLNPFLLDQNFLFNKSELERKQYFASMFAVDTSGLDLAIQEAEEKAQETRAKLKGYGEINITPVEPPASVAGLKETRAALLAEHSQKLDVLRVEIAKRRREHEAACRELQIANAAAKERQYEIAEAHSKLTIFQVRVLEHERALANARDGVASYSKWIEEHAALPESPYPVAPDFSVLEQALSLPPDTATVDSLLGQAEAQKVRYEQHLANLKRQAARDMDGCVIRSLENQIREMRAKKIAKLKELSDKSGIPDLGFDEAGNFSYEGCQAGMLSTSQLMKLSSALSALYPEGFGLELLDRGESLGKSIFSFVERAKAEKKTILATVVGERPAEVPEDVGVFVVEQGVIK